MTAAIGPSGLQRCAQSINATTPAEVVVERCPHAVQCADAFHIVKWATDALDEVRRQAWNDARRAGQTRGKGYGNRVATGEARRLKYARYALWKKPREPDRSATRQTGPPRPTRDYTAPTSSKRACATSSPSRARPASRRWTGGCPGHAAAASQPSSTSPNGSPPSAHTSTPRSSTAYPRTHRIGEHQDLPYHPRRIRIPLRHSPHRPALVMLSLGGHRPLLPGRIDPRIRQ